MREYLRVDLAREDRHEFVAGEVFRRPDSTLRHSTIAGNIAVALHHPVMHDGGWMLHAFKLRVGRDVVYYPDIHVAYDDLSPNARWSRDARLVIEVAAPETALVDRREKLLVYRRLRSLHTYLVVDEVQRAVDRYWRGDDGEWRWEELVGEGDVPVPCPPGVLTLEGIYDRLTHPIAPDRRGGEPPARVRAPAPPPDVTP